MKINIKQDIDSSSIIKIYNNTKIMRKTKLMKTDKVNTTVININFKINRMVCK